MEITDSVEQLKKEYDSMEQYLLQEKQISMLSDLNKNFRKILLLSAGSYFEKELIEILSEYIKNATNNNDLLINFLQKQALHGKYFQLFDWGSQNEPDKFGTNANRFFGLFGENFKSMINKELKSETNISDSIKSFLEVGHLRNILVHSNFAAYVYDQKTTDEIFSLYQNAKRFTEYLRKKFEINTS